MEKQTKSAIASWIGPAVLLIIVIAVMMYSFSSKSSASATDTVSRNLINAAQDYGDSFLYRLETLSKVTSPLRVLLERDSNIGSAHAADLTDILYTCSDAYRVIYCDGAGEGIDQTGAAVSIGNEEYFQNIAQFDSTTYVYVDEETTGDTSIKPSVVVVERVEAGGGTNFFLLFYPMEKFDALMTKSDFDSRSFLILVDSTGKILGSSGAKDSKFIEGGNLLDAIQPGNATQARTFRNRLDNGSRGTSSFTVGDESCMLAYVPLGVNRWEVIVGVGQDYVDSQVSRQWQNARSMMIYLIIAVFAFMLMVVIINIIGKIRTNNNKKELEDKADTDLLTGLTNKLATERKIKDYMAAHPDTQSMLFILDVDNFKKINDTLGHAFGDEVLRSLGQQITAIFRASDIIGRVGGDEFMIFLKGIADDETIRKEAKKVESFFKNFQAGEYVKYAATASIGVAIYPQEGSDFETLYKAADQGLYKAKKRGKNQLAFYRDEWAQSGGNGEQA
ncbi:MAG: GGDEF domain-containing protein [Lachnospiraceae bacterium]|nr:GGDEF domain-containing protein [Lachnospiraceae bacterium]